MPELLQPLPVTIREALSLVGGETLVRPTRKSKIAAPVFLRLLNTYDVGYFVPFELGAPAPENFEIFPANSSDANLLLNSATSAAKMYRLLAIRCVPQHPTLLVTQCRHLQYTCDFAKTLQ